MKTNNRWPKVRKLFMNLHLWSGLIGGIILFIVCLTGTIYTFAPEIQRMLEPGLYKVTQVEQSKLEPEKLISIVEEKSELPASSIIIPDNPKQMVSVAVRPEKGRPITYNINPYNGEIAGISGKGKGSGFFFTVFKLHRWLLLDTSIGRPIVGVATLLFAFGCLTGIIIWFPNKLRYWKQGLKVKFKANWKRINHDLHVSLGFYSFFFLLIMSLSGLSWSFQWYKDGLSNILGAKVLDRGGKETIFSEPADGATFRNINQQIETAQVYFPYSGTWRINLPTEAESPFKAIKQKSGFFAPSYSDELYLDAYSGSMLSFNRFSDKTFGEKTAGLIHQIHMGTLFGTASKIVYFISCLIATFLPVSGVLIWWNKLKKKPGKKNKRNTIPIREVSIEEKEEEPELVLE